ncbi:LD-carboxypeptidase [bacterium]|nr:LD-carboxypeptidase [bacterium]
MNLIKPKNLKLADTIAIIAPAGEVQYDEIMKAKSFFENLGYKIILGKHLFDAERYLAGSDEERVEDLHNAFLNKDVNAILCARGGYGCLRLLKYIDFDLIRNNPKIFCGYSDITVLSLMLLKRSGLITFSGPMAQSDFNNEVPEISTQKSFFNVLKGCSEEYPSTEVVKFGEAEGIVWGGNLSSIVSLCGIDFIPEEDFIFFTEDVNEPAYKIDKMLTQLCNMKQFRQHVKGIAFGEFTDCDNEVWLREIFKETAELLDVPAYSGFKFSHSSKKQTVPVGIKGYLDGNLTI